VSVWLDDLSRERLTAGSLAALRDRGVSGVTTNPTIFAKAIAGSDAYAGQIRDLKVRQASTDQALRELTASDVRQACDVLRTVYDAIDGLDGRVSIEVDRGSPTTPNERSPRPAHCGGWLTGPTCSSRSPLPGRAFRRSPPAWPRGSASTSR
jgi:transaldolase